MPEPLGGLTKAAAAQVGAVVRRVTGRLPERGRRTRRVSIPGSSIILYEALADFALGGQCPVPDFSCGSGGCNDYSAGLCKPVDFDDTLGGCDCWHIRESADPVWVFRPGVDTPLIVRGDRVAVTTDSASGKLIVIEHYSLDDLKCCPCMDNCYVTEEIEISQGGCSIIGTITFGPAIGTRFGCQWNVGAHNLTGYSSGQLLDGVLRKDRKKWRLQLSLTCNGTDSVGEGFYEFEADDEDCPDDITLTKVLSTGVAVFPSTISISAGGDCSGGDPPPECPCLPCAIITASGFTDDCDAAPEQSITDFNGSYQTGLVASQRWAYLMAGCLADGETKNTNASVVFSMLGASANPTTVAVYSMAGYDCESATDQVFSLSYADSVFGPCVPSAIVVTPGTDCEGGTGGDCGTCQYIWCDDETQPIEGVSCVGNAGSWLLYAGCSVEGCTVGDAPGSDGAYHGQIVTVDCTGTP